MSLESDNNLILHIKASRLLTAALLSLHAGAIVIVAVIPLAVLTRGALWLILALSLVHAIRYHGLRRATNAIRYLELGSDPEVLVGPNAKDLYQCRLKTRSVHPWAVILTFACSDRRWPRTVIIVRDAVAPEAFRRLRVHLRLAVAQQAGRYPGAPAADRGAGNRG